MGQGSGPKLSFFRPQGFGFRVSAGCRATFVEGSVGFGLGFKALGLLEMINFMF